jgi:hypothetical protein
MARLFVEVRRTRHAALTLAAVPGVQLPCWVCSCHAACHAVLLLAAWPQVQGQEGLQAEGYEVVLSLNSKGHLEVLGLPGSVIAGAPLPRRAAHRARLSRLSSPFAFCTVAFSTLALHVGEKSVPL